VRVAKQQVAFDFIACGYDSKHRLNYVQYRQGGPSGTIVATLNLTYVGSMLATVTRT
jgi:hypothetical protein